MKKFPKVMGILNVTPDSFSDGGMFNNFDSALNLVENMIQQGVDIVDIGGESTKPGSDFVDAETEASRVIPVIKAIKSVFPEIKISIDTTKYEVALKALELGADMINDVSCLRYDKRLANLARQFDVPIVLMHSRMNPKTMQNAPSYENLWEELLAELNDSIQIAKHEGAKEIIVDPGIGFAKNFDHNIEILKNFDRLYQLKLPLMLAISRKSFIGKLTNIELASDRDLATALLHGQMLQFDIDYIRVHNVNAISQLKKIHAILQK
jgi:dihydropteroate synthase